MADSLGFFVELEKPTSEDSWGLGYYVGCEDYTYDEYYLHDDGVIYDTCGPQMNAYGKQTSTGWFATEIAAQLCAKNYYNKYGLQYPYDIPAAVPAVQNIKSEPMEFE